MDDGKKQARGDGRIVNVKSTNTKHEFALYCQDATRILQAVIPGASFLVEDAAIVARISSVLRLRPGESFVLFDQQMHALCALETVNKKNVNCQLVVKQPNEQIAPAITFILPLLKRDDLEAALYSLVELGATRIQLVMTQKVQRQWGGEKEFERCQRIMIAAAEQSKNFALPELHPPVALSACLEQLSSSAHKVYFDVTGRSMLDLCNQLATQRSTELVLMVGPEGDLVPEEKELLKKKSFTFCVLTPTILRAAQAVAVGLGCFRSALR